MHESTAIKTAATRATITIWDADLLQSNAGCALPQISTLVDRDRLYLTIRYLNGVR